MRSEEHGLHMMLGFYNNAFELFKGLGESALDNATCPTIDNWFDQNFVAAPAVSASLVRAVTARNAVL